MTTSTGIDDITEEISRINAFAKELEAELDMSLISPQHNIKLDEDEGEADGDGEDGVHDLSKELVLYSCHITESEAEDEVPVPVPSKSRSSSFSTFSGQSDPKTPISSQNLSSVFPPNIPDSSYYSPVPPVKGLDYHLSQSTPLDSFDSGGRGRGGIGSSRPSSFSQNRPSSLSHNRFVVSSPAGTTPLRRSIRLFSGIGGDKRDSISGNGVDGMLRILALKSKDEQDNASLVGGRSLCGVHSEEEKERGFVEEKGGRSTQDVGVAGRRAGGPSLPQAMSWEQELRKAMEREKEIEKAVERRGGTYEDEAWEHGDMSLSPHGGNHSIFDKRINGDYSVWQSGPRLSEEGIRSCYSGTFARGPGGSQIGVWGIGGGGLTEKGGVGANKSEEAGKGRGNDALEDRNSTTSNVGVGVGASFSAIGGGEEGGVGQLFCYQVMECVVRPDVDLKRIIATAMRVSEAVGQDCQVLQRNHLIIAPRNTHASSPSLRSSTSTSSRRQSLPSTSNASNSNYEGEEDVIGADVSPLSSFRNKDRRRSGSHAASKQSTRTSAVNIAEAESSKFQDVSLTWDYVDIQVCVSKEIKHRVLLCQFLKRRNNEFRHSFPPTSPTPSQSQSQSLSPDAEGREEFPITSLQIKRSADMIRFMKHTKRMLRQSDLSLSCLYRTRAGRSLDVHFTSQLKALYRESMWLSLEDSFSVMDDHTRSVEESIKEFKASLESIYKSHALDTPPIPSRPHLSDTPLLLPPEIEFSVLNWDSAQKNKIVKKEAKNSIERSRKKRRDDGKEEDIDGPIAEGEDTGLKSRSERRKRREEGAAKEGGKCTHDELRRNSVYSGLSITASYHTSPYSTSDSETDTDTEWCYKDTEVGRKIERNSSAGFRGPVTSISRESKLRNEMEGVVEGEDDDVGGEMDDGEEEKEEEELIELSMETSMDQDRDQNLDLDIPSGGRYRDGWEEREERERESTITALDLQHLQLVDVEEGDDLDDSPSPTPWTSSRGPSTCTSTLASPVLLTSHRSPASPAAHDLAISDKTYDTAPPLALSFTLDELPFPDAAPPHNPLSSFSAINPLDLSPPNGPSPANNSLPDALPPTLPFPLSSTATQPTDSTDSKIGSSPPCPESFNDITVDSCDFNELADENNSDISNKLILDISIISDFYSYDNVDVDGSDRDDSKDNIQENIINNVNNENNTRITENEVINQLNNTKSIHNQESGLGSTPFPVPDSRSCEEREEDGMADCLIMLQRCLDVLKKSCDAEHSARLQQKNEHSVLTMGSLCDYKSSLLSTIAMRASVENSQLNKSFYSSFQSVEINAPPPERPTAQPSPVGRSVLNGLFFPFRTRSRSVSTSTETVAPPQTQSISTTTSMLGRKATTVSASVKDAVEDGRLHDSPIPSSSSSSSLSASSPKNNHNEANRGEINLLTKNDSSGAAILCSPSDPLSTPHHTTAMERSRSSMSRGSSLDSSNNFWKEVYGSPYSAERSLEDEMAGRGRRERGGAECSRAVFGSMESGVTGGGILNKLSGGNERGCGKWSERGVGKGVVSADSFSRHSGRSQRVADLVPQPVVIFYCNALVGGLPGVVYVTQMLLCLSSLTSKESFYLADMDSVRLMDKGDKKDKDKGPFLLSSLLSIPSTSSRSPLLFSFFHGAREVSIVPLAIDSASLQAVVIEAKSLFNSSSATL